MPDRAIDLEDVKRRLARSSFRAGFRLSPGDLSFLAEKGWSAVEGQAEAFIRKRLAPALPRNDGRQTPFRGHPVFVAQHATALCCRSCLQKWYGIPAGRPLTEEEIRLAVRMILEWLHEKSGGLRGYPQTPDLFSGEEEKRVRPSSV